MSKAHSFPPKDSQGTAVSQETDAEPESLGEGGHFPLDVGALSIPPGRPQCHIEMLSLLAASCICLAWERLQWQGAQSRSVGISTPGATLRHWGTGGGD